MNDGITAPNSSSTFYLTFEKNENIMHRAFGQRIREVEHVSFFTSRPQNLLNTHTIKIAQGG